MLNHPAVEAGARRLVARCTELRSYIESNEGALIDYGERYRAGKPISTAPTLCCAATWAACISTCCGSS